MFFESWISQINHASFFLTSAFALFILKSKIHYLHVCNKQTHTSACTGQTATDSEADGRDLYLTKQVKHEEKSVSQTANGIYPQSICSAERKTWLSSFFIPQEQIPAVLSALQNRYNLNMIILYFCALKDQVYL